MEKTNCEGAALPTQKERRIVFWTPEEDDILRLQIGIHGTQNWPVVASIFKDKSMRQCRRRWFNYLISKVKTGIWSPEEDLMLCKAQNIFGNRWTEIAKFVAGRTDNAVKNRFATLCRKRARGEPMAKENSAICINTNNKIPILDSNAYPSLGSLDVASHLKKTRIAHTPSFLGNHNNGSVSDKDCTIGLEQPRAPLAALTPNCQLAQNRDEIETLHTRHHVPVLKALIEANIKLEGFSMKDDPRILALKQQAEFLSSLAVQVNAENTEQSLENAWKVLENFLNETKDEAQKYTLSDVDLQLDQIKDLVGLRCGNTENQPSQRQPDLYDSPSSSEYSTTSTILSNNASEQMEQNLSEMCALSEDAGARLQSTGAIGENEVYIDEILLLCTEAENDGDVLALPDIEFGSPPRVTPLFISIAATIPSPQFSESERLYLMKTLGIESPATNRANPSQPPSCRRALVHSL